MLYFIYFTVFIWVSCIAGRFFTIWTSRDLFYMYTHLYIYICTSIYTYAAPAAARSPQSCPTLCDPIDGSPSDSAVPGSLQARILEWVAISFSNAWKWKVKVKLLSCVWLFVTPWTAAYQAPPSMGFSRQEYRSGLPLPSPMSYEPFIKRDCISDLL